MNRSRPPQVTQEGDPRYVLTVTPDEYQRLLESRLRVLTGGLADCRSPDHDPSDMLETAAYEARLHGAHSHVVKVLADARLVRDLAQLSLELEDTGDQPEKHVPSVPMLELELLSIACRRLDACGELSGQVDAPEQLAGDPTRAHGFAFEAIRRLEAVLECLHELGPKEGQPIARLSPTGR